MDQAWLQRVYNHIKQGELSNALDILSSIKHEHMDDEKYWEILGLVNGMLGNFKECEAASKKSIDINSTLAGPYNNLGSAQQNLNKLGEAESSFKQALRINNNNATAHNNLAAIYILKSDHESALPHLQRALALNPENSEALSNLGEIYKQNGDKIKALDCYLKALQSNNHNINAYIGMGMICLFDSKYEEAEIYLFNALKMQPGHPEALFNLGFSQYLQKNYNGAAEYFRRVLKSKQGHVNAAYLLAAITGENSPAHSPATYVRNLFDFYANTFDDHLITTLNYNVPEEMADLFRSNAHAAATNYMLDIGCGTGLCGVQFSNIYTNIVGVDLSGAMIEKSRQRNIYSQLHACDAETFLKTNKIEFDLVVAADVFVYVGEIDALLASLYQHQSTGGYLLFSVELLSEDTGFKLRETGRYAHSANYIESSLVNAHYNLISATPSVIRSEKGGDINGVIYLCKT